MVRPSFFSIEGLFANLNFPAKFNDLISVIQHQMHEYYQVIN